MLPSVLKSSSQTQSLPFNKAEPHKNAVTSSMLRGNPENFREARPGCMVRGTSFAVTPSFRRRFSQWATSANRLPLVVSPGLRKTSHRIYPFSSHLDWGEELAAKEITAPLQSSEGETMFPLLRAYLILRLTLEDENFPLRHQEK